MVQIRHSNGAPRLNASGALAGFTITGGQIAVVGDRLDATRQQTLDHLLVSADGFCMGG